MNFQEFLQKLAEYSITAGWRWKLNPYAVRRPGEISGQHPTKKLGTWTPVAAVYGNRYVTHLTTGGRANFSGEGILAGFDRLSVPDVPVETRIFFSQARYLGFAEEGEAEDLYDACMGPTCERGVPLEVSPRAAEWRRAILKLLGLEELPKLLNPQPRR